MDGMQQTDYNAPMIPHRIFVRHIIRRVLAATLLMFVSLGVGMWGYAHFEHMGFIDAFVNASMILGGMGPVDTLKTDGGKIFAGCYALYAGVAFLVAIAVVLAPVLHRFSHQLHLDASQSKKSRTL